jgi:hypothetical protein
MSGAWFCDSLFSVRQTVAGETDRKTHPHKGDATMSGDNENKLLRFLAEARHELEKIFNQHTENPKLYNELRHIDDRIRHAMSLTHQVHKESKEGFEPEPHDRSDGLKLW